MLVSVVLPIFNERENLLPLLDEIRSAFSDSRYDFEILAIDDGSHDGSAELLDEVCQKDPRVRAVHFRKNFGQTAAMAAGVDFSRGERIVFLDADRQNDPSDIPKLLAEIERGADAVVGWRRSRKDPFILRKFPSRIANWLIRKVGGVPVHDLGCSLKAFRREVIKEVKLYGEMHRFIPIYTAAVGGKIVEVEVNHRPRVAGVSKYGLMRTFKVLLDLVTVKFLRSYATKPMYFFGGVSFALLGLAAVSSIFLVVHKLVDHISIIQSPLLIFSAVLVILSANFLLMGILAEMQMRTYYESQQKPSYLVKYGTNLTSAEL